jgi:Fe-S-cluster containining protein
MSCHCCGLCCKAIQTNWSKTYIRSITSDGDNAKFILANWTRISKKLAFTINPDLKDLHEADIKQGYKPYYYTCNKLINNKCSVHFTGKPDICTGYPYYNGRYNDETVQLMSKSCGFKSRNPSEE